MKFIFLFLIAGSAHAQMSEWPTSVPKPAGYKEPETVAIPPPREFTVREVPPPPVNTPPRREVVREVPAPRRAPVRKPAPRLLASNDTATSISVPIVKAETRAKAKSATKSGARDSKFYFSAFYSLTNEASYSGNTTISGQSQSYSATESNSGAFGVGGGYKHRPLRGFGYAAQLGYEFARQAKGLSGTAGSRALTGDYEGGYAMSMFTGQANALYAVDSAFHVYAGVNYPYIQSQNSNVELTGQPGYQVGAGYAITQRLGVQVEFRVIRMKGSINMPPTPLQIESGTLPGFVLSIDYSI